MNDMKEHLEKLRTQIAECEIIRDLATDPKKRELFARLAEHHRVLAREIEMAMGGERREDGAAAAAETAGQSDEVKRFRDKADEAQQLAELAETKARRETLTQIAGNYLRTAEQLDGAAKAERLQKPNDRSSK